ncbi:hypothetical protein K461DRAFT_98985 [Myriangium duriaei CBS 260.36]|uniref:F-box domain-containing protein n=1 Tax=Myriangium duriaei CBS 260.36 TaxID=1168546 RepID=A0A9P4MPE9_9PEZI|nr:hypothetical protein K461DRAFT_98985 [Myriangium duriaei CBS 260.36]
MLSHTPNVERLGLRTSNFSPGIITSLTNLSRLESLHIYFDTWRGLSLTFRDLSSWLRRLPALKVLRIEGFLDLTSATKSDLKRFFSAFPNLEEFELDPLRSSGTISFFDLGQACPCLKIFKAPQFRSGFQGLQRAGNIILPELEHFSVSSFENRSQE